MPSVSPLSRRFPMRAAAVAMLLSGALVCTASQADVYKWTDANGRVVYSSVPPTGDVKVERVNTPAPASPDAAKRMANQESELKKRQLERVQEAERAEKARADASRREESCSTARGQTKALLNEGMPLYRVNERGERVLMDGAMRKRELERLDEFMRSECQERSAAR